MNKPAAILLSDGRTQAIDHAAYIKWAATLSDEALFHIMRDARQAEVAMPDGPKAGYYADEVHYCAMEVARRRGARVALDMGRATVVRSQKPTVRPSSLEEVNRTLVGQAQGGMTASPDRKGRQVKEFQVKKRLYKAGDEVVLVHPDESDLVEGLGEGVLGTCVENEHEGLVKVLWAMNSGHAWTVITGQVRLFKAASKPRVKPEWTYHKGTKNRANYLEANGSNRGVFLKGADGQDVLVHFGYGGRVSITLWGDKGDVEVRADNRLAVNVEKF